MVDFLLTPIGIWLSILALSGAVFLVGATLSLMNSLFGEMLAFYSAIVFGLNLVVGVLPALYISGSSLFGDLVAIYVVCGILLALFVFMMSAAESSRGY